MKFRALTWLVLLWAASLGAEIIPPSWIPDWFTYPPGVQGGPTLGRSIFTNVVTAGADNTGVADARAIIQACINACPSNAAVYLPTGQYRITSALYLSKNGVSLVGDGPNSTLILNDGSGSSGIIVEPSSGSIYAPANSNNIYSGAVAGSTSMALASTNWSEYLVPGRLMLVDQTNVPSMLGLSLEHYDYFSRCSGSRIMRQIVELLTVDEYKTNLTFSPPLVWSYTNAGQIVMFKGQVSRIGIEGLQITNIAVAEANINIQLNQAVDCWVTNVHLGKIGIAGIKPYYAFRCSVLGCSGTRNYIYGSSGRCYTILLSDATSDCLVEDNLIWYVRNGIMAAGAGARNVIAYNYVPYTTNWDVGMMWAFSPNHGGNPWFTLWEGNVGNTLSSDLFHAGSAHNILLRNQIWGWQTNATYPAAQNTFQRAVQLSANCQYYSVVGNVLGANDLVNTYTENTWTYKCPYPGEPANNSTPYILRFGFLSTGYGGSHSTDVDNTVVLHGNWDAYNDNVVWDATISDYAVPNSLYLRSKPAWFGSCTWPPKGPDPDNPTVPLTNQIPAELRYLGLSYSGPASPTMRTVAATSIGFTNATLNGELIALGDAEYVTNKIEWGTGSSPPFTYTNLIGDTNAACTFSLALDTLTNNTSYYYRATSQGETNGLSVGEILHFTTLSTNHTAVTLPASATNQTTATLAANLSYFGLNDRVTNYFEWGPTNIGNTYANTNVVATNTDVGTFTLDITGLTQASNYHFRVRADGNLAGTIYGSDQPLRTTGVPTNSCVIMPLFDGFSLGTVRNNSTTWIGVKFQVAGFPIDVRSLGRVFLSGNTHNHTLKVVRVSDGVLMGSATWSPDGGVAGELKYVDLSEPITLATSTQYIVASQETINQDTWCSWNTAVSTNTLATVVSPVYNDDGIGDWTEYMPSGTKVGYSYGPLNLGYCLFSNTRAIFGGRAIIGRMNRQ